VLAQEPHSLLTKDYCTTLIFDLGATITTTFDEADFKPGTLEYFKDGEVKPVQGIAGESPIKGHSTMSLQVIDNEGELVDIKTTAYYIPDLNSKLFSPQAFFQERNDDSEFIVKQGKALLWLASCLEGGKVHEITVPCNKQTCLPMICAYRNALTTAKAITLNACLTDEKNQNLTAAQKLLLCYHFKKKKPIHLFNVLSLRADVPFPKTHTKSTQFTYISIIYSASSISMWCYAANIGQ